MPPDRPAEAALSGEQAVRKAHGFSQVLIDDLKAHRLQITKAHLAQDFETAFDVALYSLRSEEHTSELQSLMRISYAVFCLKKKTKKLKQTITKDYIDVLRPRLLTTREKYTTAHRNMTHI